MTVLEDLQQDEAAGGVQDLQAEIVDDPKVFLGELGQLAQVAAVGLA